MKNKYHSQHLKISQELSRWLHNISKRILRNVKAFLPYFEKINKDSHVKNIRNKSFVWERTKEYNDNIFT